MSIIKHGILGNFSGKTGTVVGYELMGQGIMRSLPNERTKPPTENELANRKKFANIQAWLQKITPFLRVGFQNYAPTFQGFNAAKSYNSKNAVVGTFPDFEIDPALALVSFGTLPQATEASVVSEVSRTISFTWSGGSHAYDDRCMLMAYDTINGKAVYETAGSRRQSGKAELKLEERWSGKKVHVYLAFVTEDRKNRSKSQYLGEITIL